MKNESFNKETDKQPSIGMVKKEILTQNCTYVSELLRPTEQGGKKGFTDGDGNWVIEPQFSDVDVFREGVAWVKTGDSWGLIDRNGKMLISPQYEDVREFNDGLANVRVNGLWGAVDKSGNMVVRPKFEAIYTFTDGVAMVKFDGKYGFVFAASARL